MPITDRLEILFQKRQQACDLVLPSINNPTKKNQHWFDVNNHEIASLLKRKRHSYQAYMNNINNQWFKQQYQVAKAQTRKAIREMKTNFFTERADRIQELFEIGDMRGYYAALKETFGNAVSPYSNGRQSQLNTIRKKDGTMVYTSHRDRLDRLLEHLKALLNQESTVSEDIQARLPSQQPIITTIGNHFTRTELKMALSNKINSFIASIYLFI
jgi:predicted site-specific integrase-resolvase